MISYFRQIQIGFAWLIRTMRTVLSRVLPRTRLLTKFRPYGISHYKFFCSKEPIKVEKTESEVDKRNKVSKTEDAPPIKKFDPYYKWGIPREYLRLGILSNWILFFVCLSRIVSFFSKKKRFFIFHPKLPFVGWFLFLHFCRPNTRSKISYFSQEKNFTLERFGKSWGIWRTRTSQRKTIDIM